MAVKPIIPYHQPWKTALYGARKRWPYTTPYTSVHCMAIAIYGTENSPRQDYDNATPTIKTIYVRVSTLFHPVASIQGISL